MKNIRLATKRHVEEPHKSQVASGFYQKMRMIEKQLLNISWSVGEMMFAKKTSSIRHAHDRSGRLVPRNLHQELHAVRRLHRHLGPDALRNLDVHEARALHDRLADDDLS